MRRIAYKYRIYPDAAQAILFAQHFGAVRFVYNTALEMRNRYYERVGERLSRRAVQDQFVALKKTAEFGWLYDVNSQSILAALEDVHRAYENFFQGRAKFPRPKTKKSHWQGFHCPQHVQIDYSGGRVRIPKVGWVKAKLHRRAEGTIKTATVKRSPSGTYTVSILVESEIANSLRSPICGTTTRGFDLGLTHFLIDDIGRKVPNPRFLKAHLLRLAIAQKKLARRKVGSNNRARQRMIVARRHETIANHRNNFLHQQSSKLVRDNQVETLAFEDLHVKGMVRNRRLARHIADVAWGRFLDYVEYKCEWSGKNFLKCGRWCASTRECHCGYINKSLTLSDRQWTCPQCGVTHDRDVLAAQNVKKFALADALGTKEPNGSGACVKSSPSSMPVRAGDDAKGAASMLHGSHEAETDDS